jgi:hypothetical protein
MGERRLGYVVDDGKIVVNCPRCRLTKIVSVAKFVSHPSDVKLRVNCKCGHTHRASLERRNRERKYAQLKGKYIYLSDKFIYQECEIEVRDLSSDGLGFILLETPGVAPLPGDSLAVQFRINELPGGLFKKEVRVKSFRGSRIGARFLEKIRYETDKSLKIFLSS